MEIMTNDCRRAAFGMPVSGRVWMSAVPVEGHAAGAAAGTKRLGIDGTAVSGYGRTSAIAFVAVAFPGTSAWSPPI